MRYATWVWYSCMVRAMASFVAGLVPWILVAYETVVFMLVCVSSCHRPYVYSLMIARFVVVC